jgi:hypothetical protein
VKSESVIRISSKIVGILFEGGADQFQSIGVSALMYANHAKQVERVGIARVRRENLNIDPFCISQVPPLLKG